MSVDQSPYPYFQMWEADRGAIRGERRTAFKRMNERFLEALRTHHGAKPIAIPARSFKDEPMVETVVVAPEPPPAEPEPPVVPISVHLLDDLDEAELVQIRSILRRDSVRRILEEISARTGIAAVRIASQSRNKALVAARHWAFYELHEAGFSLTQVGRMFKKDHTTILHGIRKHIARTGAARLESRASA